METVVPLSVQTPGEVEAKTSGLVEAPGVAEIVNVPPGLNMGLVGADAKLVMAWLALGPMPTFRISWGAAL